MAREAPHSNPPETNEHHSNDVDMQGMGKH
jgi:hypothetical protein